MAWKTVVCLASGPSLTENDCLLVEKSKLPTIAVNNSWQLFPAAKMVFACDLAWWDEYGQAVPVETERWTSCPLAAQRHHLHLFKSRFLARSFNSGQVAIELAISRGARRVILLGYDCSLRAGTHWHGEHKNIRNPTRQSIQQWQEEFLCLQRWTDRVEIINCSRQTELTIFPRRQLEKVLAADAALSGESRFY